MSYHVRFTGRALRQLKKLDKFQAALIYNWLMDKVEGSQDPRAHGKGLSSNRSGEWRYRVGDYRILCVIDDNEVIVEVFQVGHRSTVYKS